MLLRSNYIIQEKIFLYLFEYSLILKIDSENLAIKSLV